MAGNALQVLTLMRRLLLPILAVLLFHSPADAEETALALAVKAAYLVKIQPFATWPSESFAGPDAPFELCVAGRDPFGDVLDRAVAGQSAAGRAIAVRRLPETTDVAGCQIVYLGISNPTILRHTLDILRGRPVLTITDEAAEADMSGMINFEVVDDRVRFAIDDDAAEESGLGISSKLLSLAVSVRHEGTRE